MSKNFIRLAVLWIGVLVPIGIFLTAIQEKKEKPSSSKLSEKPFVVIIPSYNNSKYCEQNLLSVLGQEYRNFRVIYVDDASSDDTYDKVKAILERSPLKNKVKLIRREKNLGSIQNLYEIIQTCENHEIVVRVDGDDFLAHPLVLKRLNKVYANENVWMTYGNYLDYPSYVQKPKLCEAFPAHIIRNKRFRQYRWVSTHLHTFYAGLFKKLSKQDLMKDNDFLPMAGDVAMIIPLLEMAGEHVRYINEVLYLYNRLNPLSDHKKNLKLQSACEKYVRSLPPYPLLTEPPYLSENAENVVR